MKKAIKILLLFLIIFLMCTSICLANEVTASNSEDSSQENSETTSETTTDQVTITNNDIYIIAEENVVMSELVNGNAYIIGNNVTITGQIAGDLFVIAQNLTIESSAIIYNNIFALATELTVKGEVNDIYAITNTFTLDTSAYIGRDLKLLSENVNLNGIIMKNAYISSNSINFGSENTSYIIRGNLHYSSYQQASIPENAVMGEVKFSQIEENIETIGEIVSQYIISFLNVIILAAVIILVSSFVTPNFANKATYCMSKRPFSTVGIGILSFVFIPVLCFILLFLGVSLYFSLALITLYFLILSITISIFSIAIGNYFANKFKETTKSKVILLSLLSVICLWLLQLIPYVGGFVSLFILVFGLGIFVFSLFVKVKKEDDKTITENKN